MDDATVQFLSDLGRKISERSGDPLDGHFLFQWISVLIQRLNAKLFLLKMGSTHGHSSLLLFSCF